MPRGNGTGPPWGSGPGTGRGFGRASGRGKGKVRGIRPGEGPSGNCICPNCGATVPHQMGIACYSLNCPKCGTKMVRD